MSFDDITLVASEPLPSGVARGDVSVHTAIQSGSQDHHAAKNGSIVHTVEVLNASRRTVKAFVDAYLPNDELNYSSDAGASREWHPEVKVPGRKTKGDKPAWEPRKSHMAHPATCPPANGHHADMYVRVMTALDDELVEVLATEEEHVYRFKCAC